MSKHSELDFTVNGNLLSLDQYHNVVNHAARYATENALLNLTGCMSDQELRLLRGYYLESVPPRDAVMHMLQRMHLDYVRSMN